MQIGASASSQTDEDEGWRFHLTFIDEGDEAFIAFIDEGFMKATLFFIGSGGGAASAFRAAQKSLFSIGFIRFSDFARSCSRNTENPNAFWYFLEPFRENGPKSLNKRQVL